MLVASGQTEFFALIFTIIIASFLMWIAAKKAHIENATYGKSLLGGIAIAVLTFVGRGIFVHVMKYASDEPGNIIGYLAGMLLSLIIIRMVYKTTFSRASLILAFFFVANLIGLIIAAQIFMGGIGVYIANF